MARQAVDTSDEIEQRPETTRVKTAPCEFRQIRECPLDVTTTQTRESTSDMVDLLRRQP
jgi:hypothetical protein